MEIIRRSGGDKETNPDKKINKEEMKKRGKEGRRILWTRNNFKKEKKNSLKNK